MTITIQGAKELRDKLEGLKVNVAKRLVAQAARKALRPLLATARKGVPVDSGNLRRSLGIKRVKRVRKGEHVLLVGARSGHRWARADSETEHDPVRYANPVEFGHVTKDGTFVPPAGFLRNAYNQHRLTVIEDFAQDLGERIDQYLRGRP